MIMTVWGLEPLDTCRSGGVATPCMMGSDSGEYVSSSRAMTATCSPAANGRLRGGLIVTSPWVLITPIGIASLNERETIRQGFPTSCGHSLEYTSCSANDTSSESTSITPRGRVASIARTCPLSVCLFMTQRGIRLGLDWAVAWRSSASIRLAHSTTRGLVDWPASVDPHAAITMRRYGLAWLSRSAMRTMTVRAAEMLTCACICGEQGLPVRTITAVPRRSFSTSSSSRMFSSISSLSPSASTATIFPEPMRPPNNPPPARDSFARASSLTMYTTFSLNPRMTV
mmetsp:Transcript_72337/g.228032  ORF Transcript_72337/g.228032 Transcript_72337/m.228032 type:complete len:285 (-) Transcript_72337:328-1182(-)